MGRTLAAVSLFLCACQADIPEARFRCAADTDCPPGMVCRASDNRCWRKGDPAKDAGPDGTDAGPSDAGCTGGCGPACTTCGPNQECVDDACKCMSDFADCDGDGSCETNLVSDPDHCGACESACPAGQPACLDGICGQCVAGGDCTDDGRPCTAPPICDAGSCMHPIAAGACLIDGACHAEGAVSPESPCLTCDPATDATSWTSAAVGSSCDDGLYCTVGDACEADGSCAGTTRSCAHACNEVIDSCCGAPGERCCDDGTPACPAGCGVASSTLYICCDGWVRDRASNEGCSCC